MRLTQRLPILIIVVFTSLVLAKHVRFSLNETAPLGRDWDFHVALSYVIHGCEFSYGKIIGWYNHDRSHSVHYPPLFYLLPAVLASTHRFTMFQSLYLSLSVWIVVLVWSVYGAGKSVGGDSWSGLAATLVAGVNPIVMHTEAFDLNLDFATMAAVALAVRFFYRSNCLSKRGPTIILGLCAGIAFLIKPLSMVHLLPFLVAASLFPNASRVARPTVRFENAMLCALVACVAASWFLVPLLPSFFAKIGQEGHIGWREVWDNTARYVWMLAFTPCSLIFAAGVVPGFAMTRKRDPAILPFLISSVTALLFFSKMRTAALGYFYPFQIWVGLLWARWLGRWAEQKRNFLCFILVLVCAVPLIVTGPGGRYRDLRFEEATEKDIGLIAEKLSGPNRGIDEHEVGYLLPGKGAVFTIRRGVFGSAVALARPGNPWPGILLWREDNVAVFCQDSMDAERIRSILAKKMLIVIEPQEPLADLGECADAWGKILSLVQHSRCKELELPYRIYATPAVQSRYGLSATYIFQIFTRPDTPGPPCGDESIPIEGDTGGAFVNGTRWAGR